MYLTNQKAIIVAGFPGVGKSVAKKALEREGFAVVDSDSSHYSWLYNEDGDKVQIEKDGVVTNARNPQFPENYINTIKSYIHTHDIVFISTHAKVIDQLLQDGVDFYVAIPENTESMKITMIERYKERGSTEAFIQLISNNYHTWVRELEDKIPKDKIIRLTEERPYLADFIGCKLIISI